MPEPVLRVREQPWPRAQLNVGNHDRADPHARLLASPILHFLGFCVLNKRSTCSDEWQQPGQMAELREILLHAPNLQKLNIKSRYNQNPQRETWLSGSRKELCLPLEPSDRLPALRELIFSSREEEYAFNNSNCRLLRQCMDWSQLRRLDHGLSCPESFFKIIGPHLAGSTSLKMVIDNEDSQLPRV